LLTILPSFTCGNKEKSKACHYSTRGRKCIFVKEKTRAKGTVEIAQKATFVEVLHFLEVKSLYSPTCFVQLEVVN
jgi:hypothetical protein